MREIDEIEILHIVQNDSERKKIESMGQKVVLNIADLSRNLFHSQGGNIPTWQEPSDMRASTGFPWSPIYADRYLSEFSKPICMKLAGAIQSALEKIFRDFEISGVLSEPVALFPTHYLLYLCRKNGSLPLFWANTYFPGFFYFVSDVHLSKPTLLPAQNDEAMDQLHKSIEVFVERVAQDRAGPVYHHKFGRSRAGVLGYFLQRSGREALVLSPKFSTFFIQLLRFSRSTFFSFLFPYSGDYMTAASRSEHCFYLRNLVGLRSYYDETASEFESGNVFFPLQYEPEASLLYAAPYFRDQFAVVESILQSLPANYILWVKEHPNQFGALRHKKWRKLRRRYKNVKFVYGRENGRHLIQRCGLVVSITSTAGLDALVYGRKCIVLGDVFYRYFPGTIPVESVKEMALALNDKKNYCIDERFDFDFGPIVSSLVEFGRFCHAGDPQPSDSLYSVENMFHLREAILRALENQKSAKLFID